MWKIWIYIRSRNRRRRKQQPRLHKIQLAEQRLLYLPIPKNACSSTKHALYEIEFGSAFDKETYVLKGIPDIHHYYKRRPDAHATRDDLLDLTSTTRFSIVRDPLDRLASCYLNRVVALGDLESSQAELLSAELPQLPDFSTFILKLDQYRTLNASIAYHTKSQSRFLGHSLEYLDKVFPLEDMQAVEGLLRSYVPELKLRHEKRSTYSTHPAKTIARPVLEHAIDILEEDYAFLKEFYSPDSAIDRYAS